LPRLNCNFRQFIEIITTHGFALHRQGATSHRRYRLEKDGKVWFVDVTVHHLGDTIKPKTLKAMIRQSGLSERLFRR
jgi:predicted RNA binding protein YcfA (HicA-like mRNA interferase family)